MESSFQLMIAYDMFYYVKFTALFIKTTCKALSLLVLQISACCVEIEVFLLLLLNKLSFSDTTVIEGGRERKHSWDLRLLFWETQINTPA